MYAKCDDSCFREEAVQISKVRHFMFQNCFILFEILSQLEYFMRLFPESAFLFAVGNFTAVDRVLRVP